MLRLLLVYSLRPVYALRGHGGEVRQVKWAPYAGHAGSVLVRETDRHAQHEHEAPVCACCWLCAPLAPASMSLIVQLFDGAASACSYMP